MMDLLYRHWRGVLGCWGYDALNLQDYRIGMIADVFLRCVSDLCIILSSALSRFLPVFHFFFIPTFFYFYECNIFKQSRGESRGPINSDYDWW